MGICAACIIGNIEEELIEEEMKEQKLKEQEAPKILRPDELPELNLDDDDVEPGPLQTMQTGWAGGSDAAAPPPANKIWTENEIRYECSTGGIWTPDAFREGIKKCRPPDYTSDVSDSGSGDYIESDSSEADWVSVASSRSR